MIKPYGAWLLIKPVEHAQVLVSDEGALSEYGTIVAKGKLCSEAVQEGDVVGFSVFGVEKLVVDDQKYYFIKENDEFLLCTIQ
jgi:co-chaperonin GroES (HSP10)